jgi:hypothetical protein
MKIKYNYGIGYFMLPQVSKKMNPGKRKIEHWKANVPPHNIKI